MPSLSVSLFNSPSLEILEEAGLDCLTLKWKKHVSSDSYRTGMVAFIDLIKKKTFDNLIVDIRNLGALLPIDEEWTVKHFVSALVDCDVQVVCVIIPEDIFGVMSMRKILKMALENIVGAKKIKFNFRFQRLSTAKLWLEQTTVV